MDVGQGDATLIEFPEGKTLLIDGGRRYGDFDLGRLAVAPYLWDRRISKIDIMAVTHPQTDHVGGLIHILQKFPVGEIWTNGAEEGSAFYLDLVRLAHRQGVPVKRVHAQSSPRWLGSAWVSILHPLADGLKSGDNNHSLVIQIQYGRHSFLFTGDIEAPAQRDLLAWGELLRSTVLKVPHHGSHSSIEPYFLVEVCPRSAVISSGLSNPYGHPAPETLAAYQLMQTRVYRTDREGAVLMTSDQQLLTERTYFDWRLVRIGMKGNPLEEEWKNWKKTTRRWTSIDPA
jgi:competence protein ComEC